MKKILLCLSRDQNNIFVPSGSYVDDIRSLGGNSGNNIFQYSIQNILPQDRIEVVSRHDCNEIVDFSPYEALVILPANILARNMAQRLKFWTDLIKRSKLPTFAIAVGAQSKYNFDFSFLQAIKTEATDFVKAILDSGGAIGVRGYFTQEVIKKLGFASEDIDVIGCPSIFVKGPDLHIDKHSVMPENLVPMVNGNPVWNHKDIGKYFDKYENSYFVDQDKFYKMLYYPEELTRKDLKYLRGRKGLWMNMYMQDRIKFYGDYGAWVNGLRDLGINFSFGSRIHGSILPILQGIPAYILATDSRVRELAEYFEIPFEKMPKRLDDLHTYYEKADYSNFNRNFAAKYAKFKTFVEKIGVSILVPEIKIATTNKMIEISAANKAVMQAHAKVCGRSRFVYMLYAMLKSLSRFKFGKIDV